MSLMCSFSFGSVCGVNELPVEVLNLFSSLVKNPSKRIEYASEIVSAGLQGRIDFSREFNIDAYEATIRNNLKLNKNNRRKKELFIDNHDINDEVEEVGGINQDMVSMSVAECMSDAYEQLLNDSELMYAISTIKSLQPMLLAEAKLDFIRTMKQAIRGIPESVALLQRVCAEYEVVAEQVKIILSSGRDFDTIFA